MDARQNLEKEYSEWLVRKQEAENNLRELEPKAAEVSGVKEPPSFTLSIEKLDEINKARKEVEKASNMIREIQSKLRELPSQ